MSSTFHNFKNAFKSYISPFSSLEDIIPEQIKKLDDLMTSNCSHEKGRIESYIQQSKDNRSYTCSRYQIEQEKFETRIEVYPKD
jgi:hypothetical protein